MKTARSLFSIAHFPRSSSGEPTGPGDPGPFPTRILRGLSAVAAALLLCAAPARASCPGGGSIFQGINDHSFAGCGDGTFDAGPAAPSPMPAAWAFAWQHHLAVQGLVSGGTSNAAQGVDSGALSGVLEQMLTPVPLGCDPNPLTCATTTGCCTPGSFAASFDFGFPGSDGCILNVLEPDVSCVAGVLSLPVMDFVVGGRNAAAPNIGRAAVISVDGNEIFQSWIADSAGVDCSTNTSTPCTGQASYCADGRGSGAGDACAFSNHDITCGTLPVPAIIGSSGTCTGDTCTIQVTIPPHSVPILDDCQIAYSRGLDCTGAAGDPRGIYVGRALMVKRAPCNGAAAIDNRTYVMTSDISGGAAWPGTIAANFVPYSPQDTNLNGVIDGTEVGPAVPVVAGGNASTVVPVTITLVRGSTDCAFLGVALLLDGAPSATGCGGGACAPVTTPVVSFSYISLPLGPYTAVADKVVNLVAGRSSGKASVSWDTTAELQTAGFNLIGTKKNGGEVQLNSSLIPAKEGTTGQGASYSVGLSGGDLKGATAVTVEVVKTSGARERFGPAGF